MKNIPTYSLQGYASVLYRSAGAGLHAKHSLDHQDVVRAPKGDVLVMLDQEVLHDEKITVLLGMRKDLDDRRDPFVVCCDCKAFAAKQRPERVRDRRLIESPLEAFVSDSSFLKFSSISRPFGPTQIPAHETASTESHSPDSACRGTPKIRSAPSIQGCGSA